jgi:hypothetical protein
MPPDFLYHYTSISALQKIVESRRLRFKRLDRVDDLNEGKSTDLQNPGRLFFVSCWTSSEEESIPLWSMYTPNMAGVRIKLPAKMFTVYVTEPQSAGPICVKGRIECPLPYDRIVTDHYIVSPTIFRFDQFLKEITYTDDPTKLTPTLVQRDMENIQIELGKLATYKRMAWKF